MAKRQFQWESPEELQGKLRGSLLKSISIMYPETLIPLKQAGALISELLFEYDGALYNENIPINVGLTLHGLLNTYEGKGVDQREEDIICELKTLTYSWLESTGCHIFPSCQPWMTECFMASAAIYGLEGTIDLALWARQTVRPITMFNNVKIVVDDSGQRIVSLDDENMPVPPKLPHYYGLGIEEYRKACMGRIDKYVVELGQYLERVFGYRPTLEKRELERHMRWLVWRIKEEWTYERIQEEEERLNNGTSPSLTAIQEAIAGRNGLARLLGFQTIPTV